MELIIFADNNRNFTEMTILKTKECLMAIAMLSLSCAVPMMTSSCSGKSKQTTAENVEIIPQAPDYSTDTMWYNLTNDSNGIGGDVFYIASTWEFDWQTEDSVTCHYADVWNEKHRADMNIEQKLVADYMSPGNNFYAPYYRHITLDSWATLNEDTIARRAKLAMGDVKTAFDHFLATRDSSRPLVIAGFSQGGMAVVELLKYMDDETFDHLAAAYVLGYKVTPADTAASRHFVAAKGADDTGVTICYNTVKDTKYIQPIISSPCVMCINPVNWRTDSVSAIIADTIAIHMDTERNVLIADNYAATEYKPILGILNVGDIHGCEPWLYSECLRDNIALRIKRWRELHK
jgi:hypothetical protein